MRYELTPDLQTGNSIIDKEHRELLTAVNQLMDAFSKGQGRTAMQPALDFLSDYVRKHFSNEELLQDRSKYPGMAAHKEFHATYRKTLQDIVSAMPDKPGVNEVRKISAHVSLLINHIRSEDKRLAQHIKDKG